MDFGAKLSPVSSYLVALSRIERAEQLLRVATAMLAPAASPAALVAATAQVCPYHLLRS